MDQKQRVSRRDVLRGAAAAALAAPLFGTEALGALEKPEGDSWRGLKVGVATYSFIKLSQDDALKAIRRVGLSYASLKDCHLAIKTTTEERQAFVKKANAAGVQIVSCGVIYLPKTEEEARPYFEYARDLGVRTMVCVIEKDAIGVLDKLVKEFDIRLAIHNHGPGDRYPTPIEVMEAIKDHDKRIGLCIDVGHTARAGVDPAECVLKFRERVYDMHIKDVTELKPSGSATECGRGKMDLRSLMEALVKIKFDGHVGFEYEKNMNDPIPGVAEGAGYLHGLLAGIRA